MERYHYLPEGWISPAIQARYTAYQLEQAQKMGTILRGRAILCDENLNLHVDLGYHKGFIPRDETACGIAEGTTREIAVLSRVGKMISFQVTGKENGIYQLSRRNAQLLTMRDYVSQLQSGDVIPVRSTHLEPFGVFVDIGCGLISMIGVENLTVSRIPHPAERVQVAQNLYAVVKDILPNRILLSHKELLGTWEENVSAFTPGMTVQGIVRRIEPYGAFIELRPNLSGLAERRDDLQVGDSVTVYIKAIIPERMKIKLVVLGRQEQATQHIITAKDYRITEGHIHRWQYHPDCCIEKQVVTVFGA